MLKNKNVPLHIGIIMDGNRRWARKKGLPLMWGHKKGYSVVQKVGKWCLKRGIKILTLYAFSTENWHRSKKEVEYLFRLLKQALEKDIKKLHKRGIKLRVIGKIEELPQDLQKAIRKAMKLTSKNTKGILNLAINYGGRLEILEAVKEILRKKIPPSKINEETFSKYTYTAGLPDPDLIIRTSGEKRLSGFLTWQSVYSELIFIKKYWPDFTEEDLEKCLKEYARRKRRFGR